MLRPPYCVLGLADSGHRAALPMTPLHPDQLRDAWRQAFAPGPPSGDGQECARRLGILLNGLPLIAAGRVQDEAGRAVTPRQVIDRALAQEHATSVDGRPFLPELVRRVLALGQLDATHPDEDPLLNPQWTT